MEKATNTLLQRRSIASLPIPHEPADLEIIYQSALTAPDHQELTPWRFITVAKENKEKLVECYLCAQMDQGLIVDESTGCKIRGKINRAPDIIICIFSPKANINVPENEQLLSMGAAIQNMIVTSNLLGGNAFWVTGNIVYTAGFKAALGLVHHEQIAGMIYLGKSSNAASSKFRPVVRDFFRSLSSKA